MLQDKPWYKSLTIWGAALFAGLQSLEASGNVPAGVSNGAVQFIQALLGLVTVIGMRRAVGANNPPA